MSGELTGNVLNQLSVDEHEAAATAKRVLLKLFDGSNYQTPSTEPYEGGSKQAIAVSEEGQTSTWTAYNVTVGTSVIGGIDGNSSRKLLMLQADVGNSDTIYLLQASGATSSRAPYLEPGDVLIDDLNPYNAPYWLAAGAANQLLRITDRW